MSLLADLATLVRPSRARRGGWVGVDVGSACIKLVEIERRGNALRIARNALIPRTPPPAETTASPAGLSETLQQHLAAANPFAGRTAACALSMSATPLQTLEIPPGTPDEQRDMVAAEMGDAPEGHTLSIGCWRAGSTSKGGLTPVYAMSVDEAVAIGVAEDLWDVGLRTHVLDGLPFALARGVQMAVGEESGPVAALDWGVSTATFIVAGDGIPLYARVFRDCGFQRLLEAVAAGFELPPADAERLLIELGLPDPRRGESRIGEVRATVLELAAGPLHQLCDEITRTLAFLKTQGPALRTQRIRLFGGGGCVANVAGWLSEQTGATVETWSLPGAAAGNTALMPLWGAAAALSWLGCDA